MISTDIQVNNKNNRLWSSEAFTYASAERATVGYFLYQIILVSEDVFKS